MHITQIESLDKGRQKIRIDNGIIFVLYGKEAKRLHLEEGIHLLEEQYEEIVADILYPRAKKRAIYLLEKMDRTEAQLREKLQQNYYPVDVIEEVIAYMKKCHYVDDFRFACNYIRYRRETKSKRQLILELCQKGISKSQIEKALEEEYGQMDEGKKIEAWLVKKNYNPGQTDVKEKQKIYQFLLRKGFQSEDILRFL